jgi:hypothetical protein
MSTSSDQIAVSLPADVWLRMLVELRRASDTRLRVGVGAIRAALLTSGEEAA